MKKKKTDSKEKRAAAPKKPKSTKKKAARAAAETAFPMVAVIAEQIRTSIPPEFVERVKRASDKREIISSVYPYRKTIKAAVYDREIELLQIELVKMQS